MKKGFTLIELLILVLMVGILTVVALPQYQTAVEKSKAMEALLKFRALEKAEQAYYLTTGHYTEDMEALSINPALFNGRNRITCYPSSYYALSCMGGGTSHFSFEIYFLRNSPTYMFFCDAYTSIGDKVCAGLGKARSSNKPSAQIRYYDIHK